MNPKAVKNFAMGRDSDYNVIKLMRLMLLADIASMLDFKEQFIAWQAPAKEIIDLRWPPFK